MNLLGAAILLVEALIVAALGRAKPLAIAVRAVAIVVGSWVVLILTMRLDTPWAIEPEVLSFRLRDRLRRPSRGTIVFIGSSTIAHRSTLPDDMHPYPSPTGASAAPGHTRSASTPTIWSCRAARAQWSSTPAKTTLLACSCRPEEPPAGPGGTPRLLRERPLQAPRGAHLLPLDQAPAAFASVAARRRSDQPACSGLLRFRRPAPLHRRGSGHARR